MPKVAIVSYNFYTQHLNYGAAIHNFAFQEYLRRKGVESIVLDYFPKDAVGKHFKYPILYLFEGKFSIRKFVFCIVNWGLGFFANLRKYRKFQEFYKAHYAKSVVMIRPGQEQSLKSVDGVIPQIWCCVSDVIWKLENIYDPVFFLDFPLAKIARRVAYAPSMGTKPFHKLEYGQMALDLIKEFDAVSVRERASAEYLTQQLKRKVPWLIDPSLLLDASDYEMILGTVGSKMRPRNSYVLIYNCMTNDPVMCWAAEDFAKQKGLDLVEVSNFFVNKFGFKHKIKIGNEYRVIKVRHKVVASAGVEEWVTLIKNAEYIFTNSFHGACFSILFKKTFWCYQRNASDFKIPNLMAEFGLDQWFVSCDDKVLKTIGDIDYESVHQKLHQFRKVAEDYIEKNIVDIVVGDNT